MTNFDKVQNYYKSFDEKNRLQNDNSGKLEYDMTMKILENNLPEKGVIGFRWWSWSLFFSTCK